MRALVIDDSRVMRACIARVLTALGYEVEQAGDGVAALELIASRDRVPDLILVDWNMPRMNGIEFIKAAKADPRTAAVPMVMVTTETGKSAVTEALRLGVQDYVMKPFTAEDLKNKLENLTTSNLLS